MKKWFTSKTLWVNVIAILATQLSEKVGITLTAEQQVAVLGVVNIILRVVTKEAIAW